MSPSPVLEYLTKGKRKLNRLIILAAVTKGMFWTASGAGLLILTAKMAGLLGADVRSWIGITLFGGVFGAFIGYNQRLSMEETARWLDKSLDNYESFSAALTCLGHTTPGSFDEAVISRAIDCVHEQTKLEWPWRKPFRWMGLALGAMLVFGLLFQIHLPMFSRRSVSAVFRTAGRDGFLNSLGKTRDGRSLTQSPGALAEKLFPSNPRLAKQMERALRQGDTVALERLFKEAEWDTDQMNERETSAAEPGKVEMQKQRMEREILAMARENGAGRSKGTLGEQSGDGKTGREAGGRRRTFTEGNNSETRRDTAGKGRGNNRIPSERTGAKGGAKQQKSSKAEQGDRGKGQQAGKGKSNVNRYWGNLNGPSGQTRALITQRKDGPMLEYVLPGKKIRTPLSQVVPHAQRAAEAAMEKDEVPGEYESFVRSYFLKLSQKSSSKSKKGEHP